jgi:hypothetical protein
MMMKKNTDAEKTIDEQLNPELAEQVQTVRGGMLQQVEADGDWPDRYEVFADPDRPVHWIHDKVTDTYLEAKLCNLMAVRRALAFAAGDEGLSEEEMEGIQEYEREQREQREAAARREYPQFF